MSTIWTEVVVYSDGSALNGQIGAAVVLYRDGTEQGTLRKHLGSEEQHTVFKAEVLNLSLAVELIKIERHIQSAVIGAVSQATIMATRHTRGTPGQYLLSSFHKKMEAM